MRREFWRDFHATLHQLYPKLTTVAEVFTGNTPMTQLADLLREDSLYPHAERLVPFIDNHDTPRFMSEPGASLSRLELAMAFLLTPRGMQRSSDA